MTDDESHAPDLSGNLVAKFHADVAVMYVLDEDTGDDRYEAVLATRIYRADGVAIDLLFKRDACELLATAIGHLRAANPDEVIADLADRALEAALE